MGNWELRMGNEIVLNSQFLIPNFFSVRSIVTLVCYVALKYLSTGIDCAYFCEETFVINGR